MITKNTIKKISQLKQKKYRNETQLFIVEGAKSIEEFLKSPYELVYHFSTNADWCKKYPSCECIDQQTMRKMSALTTPSEYLAVFNYKNDREIKTSGLILALDSVRDPGNIGTIIRLCDWFGVYQIVCSLDTVDIYNPKVIQATMGSLTRVAVNYVNLSEFLSSYTGEIIGTFMEGDNVYEKEWKKDSCIIMGNEANGISDEIKEIVTQKISIPRFGELQKTESLNVSMATSIILSESRRRLINGK